MQRWRVEFPPRRCESLVIGPREIRKNASGEKQRWPQRPFRKSYALAPARFPIAFERFPQRDYLVGMQIQGKVVIVTGGSRIIRDKSCGHRLFIALFGA